MADKTYFVFKYPESFIGIVSVFKRVGDTMMYCEQYNRFCEDETCRGCIYLSAMMTRISTKGVKYRP